MLKPCLSVLADRDMADVLVRHPATRRLDLDTGWRPARPTNLHPQPISRREKDWG